MTPSAPIIYAPRPLAGRLSWAGRLGALAVGLAALGVLLIAAAIEPDGRGVGTHEQLGLAACQWHQQTRLPCPSCGMTTSFAWFVRGNLAASFYVQPMGAVLSTLTCAVVWVGLYIAATGRPVHRLFQRIRPAWWLLPLLFGGVAAWGWKMWLELQGRSGW